MLTLFAVGPPTIARCDPWNVDIKYSARELHSDIAVLKKIYEEVHPGLYRYRPAAEIEQLFDNAGSSVQPNMTEREFLRVLSPVVTGVQCVHTVLLGSNKLVAFENSEARLFPLRVKVLNERLWVRDSCQAPGTLTGAEILSINGDSAISLIRKLVVHGSADGENRSHKYRTLERNFASRYWRYLGNTDAFDIRYRKYDAEEKYIRLNAGISGEIGACISKRERDLSRPLSLEFLTDPNVAVLTLPTFLSGTTNFPRFLKKSFSAISEQNSEALVIDLRGNSGGFDEYAILLMRYIAHKPFRYFRTLATTLKSQSYLEYATGDSLSRLFLRPGLLRFMDRWHPGLKFQRPKRNAYTGPVYALVDGGSASTAAEFCAFSQSTGRVKLVGEECGGGYQGDNAGQIRIVSLPNSRVRVTLPFTRYEIAVLDNTNRGGARPDYFVESKIEDLINGVDTEREFLLELIRGEQSRDSSMFTPLILMSKTSTKIGELR